MIDVWINIPIERHILIGETCVNDIKTWKRKHPKQSWCQWFINQINPRLLFKSTPKHRRRVLGLMLVDSDDRSSYIDSFINAGDDAQVYILHGEELIWEKPRWHTITTKQTGDVEFHPDDLNISNVLSLIDDMGYKPYKKHRPRVLAN
jgi:hypothetical protein